MQVLQHQRPNQRDTAQTHEVKIPEREMSFTFSCSGGPGGQNVNKRETKVRLSFDVLKSETLSLEQKGQILRSPLMKHLIHSDSIISIACQIHKTQGQNRQESIKMLHELLSEILAPQKERIPGGKPPNLGYPPSEHRVRQERREQQRLQRALKAAQHGSPE